MKYLPRLQILLLITLLISSSDSYSQPGWFWQNPIPTGVNLRAVRFTGPDTGIAVGDFGTILRTTNGGADWSLRTSGTSAALQAVSLYFDRSKRIQRGLAVGLNGTILYSSDGGSSWIDQSIQGETNPLCGVTFFNESTAVAVGGNGILRRTTGAGNWTAFYVSGVSATLYAISTSDGSRGIISGATGTVLYTTNRGANWTDATDSSGTGFHLFGAAMTSSTNGWLVGGRYYLPIIYPPSPARKYRIIIKTTNGGSGWEVDTASVAISPDDPFFYGVSFLNSSSGIAVGEDGQIFRTANGGSLWQSQFSGSSSDLLGISFSHAAAATAVGLYGEILKSTNSGLSWSKTGRGTRKTLRAVSFLNPADGLACGDSGKVLRTIDGGHSWTTPFVGTDAADTIYSISRVNLSNAFLAANNGKIYYISSGTVYAQQTGTPNDLFAITMTDLSTGTAVGDSGTIMRTQNGGLNWTPQTSNTNYALYGVHFLNADLGTAVGAGGTILHTPNGGRSWGFQNSGISGSMGLLAVHLLDDTTGIVVGDYGWVLKTTDGGATWTRRTSGTGNRLKAIYFYGRSVGYAVGTGGVIIKTTDEGESWSLQASSCMADLYGISFGDQNQGNAVGALGTILRTTSGGVPTGLEIDEISGIQHPQDFVLEQNYPNPFNPSTVIHFRLDREAFVSLKIYNILAEEIATLVSRDMKPGTYEAAWDGAGMPSGLYFYRLKAGSFNTTRKMVLIR